MSDSFDAPRSPSGLRGKRVLVARAEGQTAAVERLLLEHGALPIVIPTLQIGPPDDEAALDRALCSLTGVDWVIFTSANGVLHTWQALDRLGLHREAFGEARFAVVGTATRDALVAKGVPVAVVAKEFRGAGLATSLLEALRASPVSDTRGAPKSPRVLLLRAQEASNVLPAALADAGIAVEVVAVYRTRAAPTGAAEIRAHLEAGTLDIVIFSSGSTVHAVCEALGSDAPARLARVRVACIGPVTAEAAEARGLRVDVVPKVATFPEVIAALENETRAI